MACTSIAAASLPDGPASSEGRRVIGQLFDRLTGSPAWSRLQERSPEGADRFTVNVKHDLVNVLQALAAAADEALEHAIRADEELASLKRDLYDPHEGDFAKARRYVDGRMSTWSKWLAAVAGGVAVAAFGYLLKGGV